MGRVRKKVDGSSGFFLEKDFPPRPSSVNIT
jgi:hypothetical protein